MTFPQTKLPNTNKILHVILIKIRIRYANIGRLTSFWRDNLSRDSLLRSRMRRTPSSWRNNILPSCCNNMWYAWVVGPLAKYPCFFFTRQKHEYRWHILNLTNIMFIAPIDWRINPALDILVEIKRRNKPVHLIS